MRAIIINLTRLGDLLQTQPVIHALKQEGYQVGLICLTNFAEASSCLKHLDYLYPLPGGKLLSFLDKNWYISLKLFQDWIEHIHNTFPMNRIINLTSHLPAKILAKHLAGTKLTVEGFSIDDYGFGINDSMWAKLLEASTKKRACSPYNLVDLFRKIGHVGHIQACYQLNLPPKQTQKKVCSSFGIQVSLEKSRYVGFQLGASAARRQWPVKNFAALGEKLYSQFGILPILFGTNSEQPLFEEYKQTGAPYINLIGKTTVSELTSILPQIQLLITNDTGTMHLAAGLGVPSLAIFLSTAQPHDTAPYLEDCCCIEPALTCHPCDFNTQCPHDTICRITVSPESIWPIVSYRLTHNIWPQVIPKETTSIARVWLTTRDSYGFLDLYSISGHNNEDQNIWLTVQRHFYRQFIDLIDNIHKKNIYTPLPSYLVTQLSEKFKKQVYSILEQALGLLLIIEQQGKLLNTPHIRQIGKKFLSTVHNFSTLLTKSHQFNALGQLWTISVQEHGDDLIHVIKLSQAFKHLIIAWKNALMPL